MVYLVFLVVKDDCRLVWLEKNYAYSVTLNYSLSVTTSDMPKQKDVIKM